MLGSAGGDRRRLEGFDRAALGPFLLVFALLGAVGHAIYTAPVWPLSVELPSPLGEPEPTPLRQPQGLAPVPPAPVRPASTAAPARPVAAVASLAATPTPAPLTELESAGRAVVLPQPIRAPPATATVALPTPTPSRPTPTAPPQPTPGAPFRVANTDGDGVYLRASPRLADKLDAWPDGTLLGDLGREARGDGLRWARVRAPDGAVGWVPTRYLERATAPGCRFVLGFARLRALLGAARVGDCLEDEHHDPATGDTVQRTTRGLLVWRRPDGGTAFTDGRRTWVLGPRGLQERANDERFAWESRSTPTPARPTDRRIPD